MYDVAVQSALLSTYLRNGKYFTVHGGGGGGGDALSGGDCTRYENKRVISFQIQNNPSLNNKTLFWGGITYRRLN